MEKKRVFDVGMLPDKWHSCWGICLIMTLLFVNSPLALFADVAAVASTTQATKIIKGTVTGVDKEPLIGVLITVKGTAQGVITGADGQYEITNVSNNAILVFSYIGYQKQEIKFKNVIRIYKTGFFIFAISFLGLYIMNVPKYAIDDFLNEHIQAIYGIIIMPATVVGLFGQFIIHPYLNIIAGLHKEGKLEEVKKILVKIILVILTLGLICVVGAYILGIPVLELIYGIDLKEYRIHLSVIILASTLSVIGTIYSSMLTTIRKTFIQFIIYCILTVIAIISSYLLTYYLGINGATGAYFVIMSLQFLLYYLFTNSILDKMIKEKSDET